MSIQPIAKILSFPIMSEIAPKSYKFTGSELSSSKRYVLPKILGILDSLDLAADKKKVFDIGCGNGSTLDILAARGFEVAGVDPSTDGVDIANEAYPHLKIETGSAYDDLAARYGEYPTIISLEVIEHLYNPRQLIKSANAMLAKNGNLILSTPYHGYWKNLALAITGKLDNHFTVLSDDMHIKFFSRRTLQIMLEEFGFRMVGFWRVGRIPPFAGSMIVHAKKTDENESSRSDG